MADHVLKAYGEGSGSELQPYVRFGKQCPAKMSSIASSSAMTFNLLGNTHATILPETKLPQGVYQVQYMSAKDFSDSLDMPQAKRNYLTRYFT